MSINSTSRFDDESEPLLFTQNNKKNANKSYCNAAKSIARAYRIRTTLFFTVILLIVVSIIIYAITQENISSASPTWVRMETSHTRANQVPAAWTLKEECDETHPFELTVAIRQQNIEFLESHVAAISDPKNELYHKYWTPNEIRAYFKPSIATIDSVTEWLSANGFTIENGKINIESHGVIKVSITCGAANRLLNAKYNFYENTLNGKTHLHVEDGVYNIPQSVVDHIDFISPTIRFPLKRHTLKTEPLTAEQVKAFKARNSHSSTGSNGITYNTPDRLTELYQMTEDLDKIVDGNGQLDTSSIRQSVASFDEEYYSDDDLDLFWQSMGVGLEAEMERVPADQEQGTGSEAELDTQYITTTGEGIYTYVYYIDSDSDPFLPLSEMILGQDIIPSVLSISYGAAEELGRAYLTRCDAEFAKLALVGVTILASSGDSGVVSSESNGVCAEYDGAISFDPQFPASSIYVTAVGGTEGGDVPTDSGDSTGETAWYYSGGGFSKYFAVPDWQTDAIATYLETAAEVPDSDRFNSQKAAYPDISAQSVTYIVVIDGNYYSVSGTSASCPVVAGMVSMINYARSEQGKAPLGQLNRILYELYYQHSYDDYYFNDIVEGYNEGCTVDNDIGFYTAAGWDPVTGVGSPKFNNLYDALLAYD